MNPEELPQFAPPSGDGGAPSADLLARRLRVDDLLDESLLLLTVKVLRRIRARFQNEEADLITRRALYNALHSSASALIVPFDKPSDADVLLWCDVLENQISPLYRYEPDERRCPICNDLGVAARGAPCPAKCQASVRSAGEPPIWPDDPNDHHPARGAE